MLNTGDEWVIHCTPFASSHTCMSLQMLAHNVQFLSLAYSLGDLTACQPSSLASPFTTLWDLDSSFLLLRCASSFLPLPLSTTFPGPCLPGSSAWHSTLASFRSLLEYYREATLRGQPGREAFLLNLSVLLPCLIFFILLLPWEIPFLNNSHVYWFTYCLSSLDWNSASWGWNPGLVFHCFPNI